MIVTCLTEDRIQRMIASDPDAPEATDDQIAQAKPFAEAFPVEAEVLRAAGRAATPKGVGGVRPDRGDDEDRMIRDFGLEDLGSDISNFMDDFAKNAGILSQELTPQIDAITKRLHGLATSAMPHLQQFPQSMERLDDAEHLMKRGWVPNRTTPFPEIVECRDDISGSRLNEILLAHYTDDWTSVKSELNSSVDTWNVDEEAKAVFREALSLHEARFYRSVSRLLFPEIERLFRTVLLEDTPGHVGTIDYLKIANDLSASADEISLETFTIAGIQDMVLFAYLCGGHKSPEYEPGLGTNIDQKNITGALASPIPTRHAVVHGLVGYPEPQHSLNAIFIADYFFSLISSLIHIINMKAPS